MNVKQKELQEKIWSIEDELIRYKAYKGMIEMFVKDYKEDEKLGEIVRMFVEINLEDKEK